MSLHILREYLMEKHCPLFSSPQFYEVVSKPVIYFTIFLEKMLQVLDINFHLSGKSTQLISSKVNLVLTQI